MSIFHMAKQKDATPVQPDPPPATPPVAPVAAVDVPPAPVAGLVEMPAATPAVVGATAPVAGVYLVSLLHLWPLKVEAESPEQAWELYKKSHNITASVHQPDIRLMTTEEVATHTAAKA